MKITLTRALACLALVICAVPAFSAESIAPGYDLWQTIGGGATLMDFRETPIPAGFFCDGSAAFDGKISFDGQPLVTDPAGALGTADTIIERMDYATFKNGVAHTRIRASALNLISVEPLSNGCGEWVVRANLASDQPVTDMMYKKESDFSGSFFADLVITVKLTFINTYNKSEVRTMERTVHFTEFHDAPYTLTGEDGQAEKNDVLSTTAIDFDNDGNVDGPLPITVSGLTTVTIGTVQYLYPGYLCPYPVSPITVPPCISLIVWHRAPLHNHTTWPPICGPGVTGWCRFGGTYPIDDAAVIGTVDDDNNFVLTQLKNMETRGLIDITAEELYEQLMSKAEAISIEPDRRQE